MDTSPQYPEQVRPYQNACSNGRQVGLAIEVEFFEFFE
jgi:hypothetical protein